jgi:hypothetical protein
MINQKDRERIEEAAKKHSIDNVVENNDDFRMQEFLRHYALQDFKAGAEYENAISYNQALEDVIKALYCVTGDSVYEEIQKLKKDI